MRSLIIVVLGMLALVSTTPGLAQNNTPPYVTAAFADLSQRLGKTYLPVNGLPGSWSYSEIPLDANDSKLGCASYTGAPINSQKGAWQILITINGVGDFDYRATLDGKTLFLCSGPANINTSALPPQQSAQPQKPATFEAPVVAYIDAKSGNVYVTSMRPNAGPFALTQDAAPSGESPLTYSTSPFYSRLSWSPDGSSLAFTDEHGNLFVATSGQAVKKIASIPTADFIGAWSADGSEIAYAVRADNGSGEKSTYQVQAIPRTGGQPRYVGTFSLINGGIGFVPRDLSQAIATQDNLAYSATFVWTKLGIVHSITTSMNLGLALDGLDGKEIWNVNVDHAVVSPDQTRAVAIQGQQVVVIDLASGKVTPLPIQTTPDAMAWSSDSQTIYYSTSTKLSEVAVNQNTAGAKKIEQLSGGLPGDSAVSNNVQLWSIPASGGTPTALFGQEGYAIAWISPSPVPNNALIAFSFVASSVKLYTDANAGKTDLSQDYPTIRVGTVVPGQAPTFFDSPSRKPLISAAAEFVTVPVGSGAPAAGNASSAPSTCSQASNTAATITVTNKTSQTVLLMWVDFNCKEQQYNSIAPGVSVTQGTFTGHVWRIEDAASHKVLKEFTVTQNATITVP